MNGITSEQKAMVTKDLKIGIIKELFNQNKISQEQFSKLMLLQYKK